MASALTQLLRDLGGLYEQNVTARPSPRRMLALMERTSSMPENSASSSNQSTPKYPLASLMDFDLPGSSAPRNRIR